MRMVRLGQTYQGAMMAKNAKKNRSKALQKATSKGANHPKQAQKPQNSPDPQVQGDANCDANAEVTAPVERCESLPPMDLHTRMGILDDEIYTQLIEPAFQAFALEDEETGLRMLAESVVSAIAAREDYAKFRKLDDICQRYLYYIESFTELKRRTRERVEIQGLCTYWRSQMCMAFVCDSRTMRHLLLPSDSPEQIEAQLSEQTTDRSDDCVDAQADSCCGFDMRQARFLRGVDSILNPTLGAGICGDRNGASCRDLYDFAHGMSFPWIGFDPDRVFNLKHIVFDEALCVSHCFARLDAAHVDIMWQRLQKCLCEALFIDLLYAQHRKLYDEIHNAFDDDDRLPCDFLMQIRQRIRFDKAYQTAHDDILCGKPLVRPLHRSSRLDVDDLNAFATLAAIWSKAAAAHQGLYAFHYFG